MCFSYEPVFGSGKTTGAAILFLMLVACDAKSKSEGLPTRISCPERMSDTTHLKPGAIKLGILTPAEKILQRVGLVEGLPSDTLNPIFSDEIIEEWEDTQEGARAIEEYYPGKHDGLHLRCDYWPKGKYDGRAGGYQKADGRVTLMLPLPDPPGLNCTFIRNPDEYRFHAACELK